MTSKDEILESRLDNIYKCALNELIEILKLFILTAKFESP
jgi:hypothetical protein